MIVLGFHYLQLNPHLPNVGSSCHNKLLQPFLGHTSNLPEVGNDFRNSAYVDLLFKDMDQKKEELRKLTVKLFAQEIISEIEHTEGCMKICQEPQHLSWAIIVPSKHLVHHIPWLLKESRLPVSSVQPNHLVFQTYTKWTPLNQYNH